MWVVMVPQKFSDMELVPCGYRLPLEIKMRDPDAEPYRYLPVFETYDAAVAWNGGADHIVEVREIGR